MNNTLRSTPRSAHWDDPTMPWPLERLREFLQLSDELPRAAGWQTVPARVADLRALLAERDRLAGEVEALHVELGAALAPDDYDEPLTSRDVDPEWVAQCEEEDRIAEKVYEPWPGDYEEAPF